MKQLHKFLNKLIAKMQYNNILIENNINYVTMYLKMHAFLPLLIN